MKKIPLTFLFQLLTILLICQTDTLQIEKPITEMNWNELSAKADSHYSKKEYDEVVLLEDELIKMAENEFGENHDSVRLWIRKFAVLYANTGQFEKSISRCIIALEKIEKEYGKEHPQYASFLNHMAVSYFKIGQFEKAISCYINASEIMEKELGKDNRYYVNIIGNLASTYQALGQYEKAIPLFNEALMIYEETVGKENSTYGIMLANLANMYVRMGQLEKAVSFYQEALEIIDKTYGATHEKYGIILGLLAGVYQDMGSYDIALRKHLEALVIVEKALGKKHPEYGIRLSDIGTLYLAIKDYEKSLSFFEEALKITKNAVGKTHQYSRISNNLGVAYLNTEEYTKADSIFLETLKINEAIFGKEYPELDRTFTYLGHVNENKDSLHLTTHYYQLANQYIYDRIANTFAHFSEYEQINLINTVKKTFQTIPSFSIRHPEYNELIELNFDNTLLLKDLILNNRKAVFESLRKSKDSMLIHIFREWENTNKLLIKQYSLPLKDRVANFDSLVNEANKLESGLARQSKSFQESRELVNWKQIQKELTKNDAIIEFTHFRYFENPNWTDSIFYAAMVLRSEYESPKFILLFEEKELENLLLDTESSKEDYLSKIYSSRGVVPRKEKSQTKSLYSLIWEPLDSLLTGAENVYYSPTGLLHRISFPALSMKKKKYLSEKHQIHYLSNSRKLAFQKERIPIAPESLVLYGGIHYDSDSSAIASANQAFEKQKSVFNLNDYSISGRGDQEINWQYLPGTEKELNKIKNLFDANNISATSIKGYQATEESFKTIGEDKPSPSILHIATHGFFFPDLKKDKENLALGGSGFRFSENPLIRSGLIMAGANQAWQGKPIPDGIEDGILTAYEISNMNLSNTKLVVLSACETGLGDIKGSEGVFGLQRAFKMAGVDNIIMSLWQVPDEQTGELMEKFYSFWLNDELTIREAFQNAQKEMQTKYKDPYYWAGFVLIE